MEVESAYVYLWRSKYFFRNPGGNIAYYFSAGLLIFCGYLLSGSGVGVKVLVVDDNVTYLNQMKKYLSLHALDVQTAEGGKKALELMGKKQYDVVILDLKMPDISGIDVLKRAHKQDISSKFIVITGYGRVDTAVESMKLGAVDYLQKPFAPEVLLKLIKKVFDTSIQIQPFLSPFSQMTSLQVLKKICKGKTIFAVTGSHVPDRNPIA